MSRKSFWFHDKKSKMAPQVRWLMKLRSDSQFLDVRIFPRLEFSRLGSTSKASEHEEEEFGVINIFPVKKREKTSKPFVSASAFPPRTTKMSVDQDWTSVWPGPRTFHPGVVPLPLRQGYNKTGPPLSKFGNTELMKIPNFLHLTPPAIEKHCEAIQEFCTKWPESLETEEDMEKQFPVEIITTDYCHSSPSIREPQARIVSLRVKVSSLNLDYHARDKFLRLVGKRYDPETDYVTITTDSCPIKKQNYSYAQYLLTALYYESWKFEDWEKEKSVHDMETYIFSQRKSFDNVKKVFKYNNNELPDTQKFGEAVEDWHNNGDSEATIENYKKASLKLLSLPSSLNPS